MNYNNINRTFDETIDILEKLKHKKLIFFGTGSMAESIINLWPIDIEFCVDNDCKKQGEKLNGIKICSPKELEKENKEEIFVLVTTMYYEDVSLQLRTMGLIENISFANGKSLYEFALYYNGVHTKKPMKKYLSEFIATKISISSYRKIMITQECCWLGLSMERLFVSGLMRGYYLLFADDNINSNESFFYEITDNYKEITFKGINLYHASLFYICFELKVSVDALNPKVERHKEKILHWYNICCNYILQVLPYFEEHFFHKIVIFQGHFYQSAVLRQLGMVYNTEVLCLENTFNKNKAIWDNVSALTVNKNSSKNFFWRYKDLVDTKIAEAYVIDFNKKVKELKMAEHITPLKKYEKLPAIKTIVFIGQVYLDSSTLFGMWDYKDAVEVISILVDYCISNSVQLIIKLHPKESSNEYVLNDTLKHIQSDISLAKKIKQSKIIMMDYKNEYDTYSLIDLADVCVTINSQAGLEALVKGKDVILCGISSYGGLGFTYEAYNEKMLKCFLDMKLKEGISLVRKDDIYKYFYIFNELYCINKDEDSILDKITNKP